MDMTTLARVKARLENYTGTDDDTVLSEIITSVSSRAGVYLNRVVETAAQTEYHDLQTGREIIGLKGYPVSSSPAPTVTIDSSRAFTGDALSTTSYYIEEATGLLFFESQQTAGRGACKVTYTGGMAADTSAFITAYPEITQAVDNQVALEWKRRRHVGVTTTGSGTGSRTLATQDLIESLRMTLDPHRRANVC